MARRTVEDFNGFVAAARPPPPPPKKSTRAKPATTTTAAGTASGRKPKAVNAQPPPAKKRDLLNTHSVSKVEKPQRNVTGKKLPAYVERKEVKIKQIQKKVEPREEKVFGTMDSEKSAVNGSPDVSDDEEYEDDFEDYESDFESDTSVDSSILVQRETPQTVVKQPNAAGGGVKFALPVCVEEKLEPFLDEKFEINSLERTIEMGLKNFQTAGKRKREQEAKEKVHSRGNVLMEMIKLDTVSYSLLDLPAIPYEQYIKMYGRSNMTQVHTQTHDDNAEKEIQTNDIDFAEKWTQRPIVLVNGLDCSSSEYIQAKLGVGGGGGGVENPAGCCNRPKRIATADPVRVSAVGRTVLSVLDRRAMDQAERRLTVNALDFSAGHLSPAVTSVAFLAGRPVTSVEFARLTSAAESVITAHEAIDPCLRYVICVWNLSNAELPEYVLKCPGRVTSLCTVHQSTASGFVVTAHADGSVCVWDLRESRLHHRQIDSTIPFPIRSPSFNTAISIDQGHRSKIVGLSAVTYNNNAGGSRNEQLPDEICSLDEDFGLNVWTVVDDWADASEISEHSSAGTAPWSSVRLVKMQTLEANKNVPRYLSDGVAATCLRLNNDQDAFIGTDSGLVVRCNLGGHRVWPQYYTYEDTGEHFTVNSLDICPFDLSYFLTACSSNEVMLYCVSRREALRRFFTSGAPKASTFLVKAQWCTGFPGIVFGLDSRSGLHVWDLCDDVATPVMSVPLSRGKSAATSMSLTSTRKNQNTYVGLAFDDGAVELHRVKMDKRNTTTTTGVVDYGDTLATFLASL